MNSSFKDGIQFAWDASSLELAEACLYKYKLVMIDGWRAKAPNVHLRFGGHFATALEHYHKLRAAGKSYDEATFLVVQEALIESWDHERDDLGFRIPGTGTAWDSQDSNKNRHTLIRSIIWYLDYFKDDTLKTVILETGAPAVEYSFSFEVDNGIMFSGHLDRLAFYGDDIYVTDNKTTKTTLSAHYFRKYDMSTQMSMYTFAGKIILNNDVKGVIIDAAQVAVGFTRFERGMTFRAEGNLNEWYDDTMYHIETARKATADNYFPMNRTACENYGGCQFKAICSMSPEQRHSFLEGDFTSGNVWDPLQRR